MGGDDTEPLAGVDHESVIADSVDPDEVRAALHHERPVVRQRGARVCAALAREDAAAARQFASDLGELLGDDNVPAVRLAGTGLRELAGEYPGDLVDSLPYIVDLLESDLGGVSLTGAKLLSPVVLADPDACLPYLTDVVDALVDIGRVEQRDVPDNVTDRETRRHFQQQEENESRLAFATVEILSNVVVALAEANPEEVGESIDELVRLLDVENATTVGGGVDAIAEVADADPDAVAPAIEPLLDCLDHVSEGVRARTILALAKTRDDRVLPALRTVEAEDDDEEIREMAGEVADALEDDLA